MSIPPPRDRATAGRERLAARARRINLIRRRVAAATLAAFALAWGVIVFDGSMGTTTHTATASTTTVSSASTATATPSSTTAATATPSSTTAATATATPASTASSSSTTSSSTSSTPSSVTTSQS